MFGQGLDRDFRRFRDHGDVAALGRVFDAAAPRLFRFARHPAATREEAEDVLQATFLAAMESAQGYDDARPVLPWLAGILSRQAGLARRRAGRAVEEDRLAPRRASAPEERARLRELKHAVGRAVAGLPATYRDVVALHLTDGERPDGIARRLGRRSGTVRVQLHRGLALLRRALPGGFGAAALATLSREAHAGLRSTLLEAARSSLSTTAAASIAAPVTLAGGVLMSKVLIGATAGAFAVLGAGLWFLSEDGAPETPAIDARAAAESATEGDAARPVGPAGDTTSAEPVSAHASTAGERVGAALPAGEPAEAAPTAASAPVPFAITGRAVDEFDERPLSGAVLRVGFGDQQRSATSGADGRFRIEDVDHAPVSLTIELEGYVAYPELDAPWDRERFARHLVSGAAFDLGEVRVSRGVTVGGRVLDAGGAPVAGADVYSFLAFHEPLSSGPRGLRPWRVGTTDAAGAFTVPQALAVSGSLEYEYGFFAASPAGAGWCGLQLLRDQSAAPEVLVEVEPGAPLAVRVLDAQGRPVAGARAVAWPRFLPYGDIQDPLTSDWLLPGAGRELFAAATDADGWAHLEHLPLTGVPDSPEPGLYVVAALAEGWTRPVRAVVDLGGGAREVELQVGPTAVTQVEGRVVDAAGQPFAGALVRSGGAEARSALDGRFRLDAVPEPTDPGERFEVHAEQEGFATARTYPRFVPGGVTTVGNLVMRPAAPLSGVVLDPQGRGLEGAQVVLDSPPDVERSPPRIMVTTDAEGRFEAPDASAGAWHLHVFPPRSLRRELAIAHEELAAELRTVEIRMRAAEIGAAQLVATVVDAVTGAPLTPERALLQSLEEPTNEVRTPTPRVEPTEFGLVANNVPPGRWRLYVRVAERAVSNADFEIAPGQLDARATVRVGAPRTLRGRVLGLAGADVEGRILMAELTWRFSQPAGEEWGGPATNWGRTTLAADGRFEFEGLTPGRYRVQMFHPTLFAYAEVDLPPDADAEVELRPQPGAIVSFAAVVPRAEGRVLLRLFQPDGAWSSAVWLPAASGALAHRFVAPAGELHYELAYDWLEGLEGSEFERRTGTLRVAWGDERTIDVAHPIAR